MDILVHTQHEYLKNKEQIYITELIFGNFLVLIKKILFKNYTLNMKCVPIMFNHIWLLTYWEWPYLTLINYRFNFFN